MLTDSPAPAPDQAANVAGFHRELAEELFSQVLALLERTDRTCAENDRMIHAAHASRFHYDFGGNPLNWGLGEWQCSRVHTALGQADAALYHGWRYLEIAESYGLGPFHFAYAHTALASAFALRKPEESKRHLQLARDMATHATEEEERNLLASEIEAIEKGDKASGGCCSGTAESALPA